MKIRIKLTHGHHCWEIEILEHGSSPLKHLPEEISRLVGSTRTRSLIIMVSHQLFSIQIIKNNINNDSFENIKLKKT